MSINSAMYMHDSDKTALKALKAIPGFTPVLRAFMKIWDEQQFRIENMSSNLRLGPQQMPEYYNMLPPICEKLGIDVPDLYLTLDVEPNAYTFGDTRPFIVMTSGLLETLPKELIPSVLAHECGHIACHHVLYTTMGSMLLRGTLEVLGLGLANLVSLPLLVAFYYWMRCSEYSADRAASICDLNSDKVVETCMYFSGYDKDFDVNANMDAFMAQAAEYREMVTSSAWNKMLEFSKFRFATHPLSAVRAYECDQWSKSENFAKIQNYLAGSKEELPLWDHAKHYIGLDFADVVEALKQAGFTNIELVPQVDKSLITAAKPRQVLKLLPGGNEKFLADNWYPADLKIVVVYYAPEGNTNKV